MGVLGNPCAAYYSPCQLNNHTWSSFITLVTEFAQVFLVITTRWFNPLCFNTNHPSVTFKIMLGQNLQKPHLFVSTHQDRYGYRYRLTGTKENFRGKIAQASCIPNVRFASNIRAGSVQFALPPCHTDNLWWKRNASQSWEHKWTFVNQDAWVISHQHVDIYHWANQAVMLNNLPNEKHLQKKKNTTRKKQKNFIAPTITRKWPACEAIHMGPCWKTVKRNVGVKKDVMLLQAQHSHCTYNRCSNHANAKNSNSLFKTHQLVILCL